MKNSLKTWLLAMALFGLVACRDSVDSQADAANDGKRESRREPASGGSKSTLTGEERENNLPKIARLICELNGASSSQDKRDLFADMMLGLPTDEHEIAVEVVVADLNSGDSANLVSKYLEISSLMSPALQLPGIVRLLEEPNLLPLQRAAMEQQLRQDLEIPAGQAVKDWRLKVADHLRKNEALIPE